MLRSYVKVALKKKEKKITLVIQFVERNRKELFFGEISVQWTSVPLTIKRPSCINFCFTVFTIVLTWNRFSVELSIVCYVVAMAR